MNFDEWLQEAGDEYISRQEVWNAAIDEAVKRINKAGFFDGDVSSDYVAKAVEKLKDGI